MRKTTYPPAGTPERRFLDVLLSATMHLHPEYVQELGNRRILALCETLRGFGWDVHLKVVPQPTIEQPGRHVFLCYIGEHTLDAAMGDDVDE